MKNFFVIKEFEKYPFIFEVDKRITGTFPETFHTHQSMDFIYVQEGTGYAVIDQKYYPLKSGSFVFTQPYQLHRIHMEVDDKVSYVSSYFSFHPSFQLEYLKSFPILHDFFLHLTKNKHASQVFDLKHYDNFIVSLFRQFQERYSSLPYNEQCEEFSFCTASLIKLLRNSWVNPTTAEGVSVQKEVKYVEKIMDWVEANYKTNFNMDVLVEEMFLSPGYISHLFRRVVGMTISEFINQRRMREACRLLSDTTLSAVEVANQIGLSNPSYFSKLFKSQIGISPTQFRKRNYKNYSINESV